MKLLKKGLIRGVIPFGFSIIISLLWNQLQGTSAISNTFFFYGLIAFFLGMASVIYEIEKWRFLKQIMVHYLAMLMTVFPTLLLSGFYPLDSFRDAVNVFFLFNKVGVILFLTTYFIFTWRKRAYLKARHQ
ncbi:DUF3021 family protein [Rossellomorea aquimaris]|uniref:DUF3021 family protein n=1 Tax=Rossellomorea aquimaris TaxID=189382 RepID=UPI0011E8D89B|nr:DUF3021 family protein [Rossellomorea aquimaris]TYS89877.1 DUF3021 domain-containing protein [Rossellomorea aquimaris]